MSSRRILPALAAILALGVAVRADLGALVWGVVVIALGLVPLRFGTFGKHAAASLGIAGVAALPLWFLAWSSNPLFRVGAVELVVASCLAVPGAAFLAALVSRRMERTIGPCRVESRFGFVALAITGASLAGCATQLDRLGPSRDENVFYVPPQDRSFAECADWSTATFATNDATFHPSCGYPSIAGPGFEVARACGHVGDAVKCKVLFQPEGGPPIVVPPVDASMPSIRVSLVDPPPPGDPWAETRGARVAPEDAGVMGPLVVVRDRISDVWLVEGGDGLAYAVARDGVGGIDRARPGVRATTLGLVIAWSSVLLMAIATMLLGRALDARMRRLPAGVVRSGWISVDGEANAMRVENVADGEYFVRVAAPAREYRGGGDATLVHENHETLAWKCRSREALWGLTLVGAATAWAVPLVARFAQWVI